MMTKKDYIRAVETIKQSKATGKALNMLIVTFADFFRGDNPRFDESRFFAACEKDK